MRDSISDLITLPPGLIARLTVKAAGTDLSEYVTQLIERALQPTPPIPTVKKKPSTNSTYRGYRLADLDAAYGIDIGSGIGSVYNPPQRRPNWYCWQVKDGKRVQTHYHPEKPPTGKCELIPAPLSVTESHLVRHVERLAHLMGYLVGLWKPGETSNIREATRFSYYKWDYHPREEGAA